MAKFETHHSNMVITLPIGRKHTQADIDRMVGTNPSVARATLKVKFVQVVLNELVPEAQALDLAFNLCKELRARTYMVL